MVLQIHQISNEQKFLYILAYVFSKKSLVFHGTECPKDMLHKQY